VSPFGFLVPATSGERTTGLRVRPAVMDLAVAMAYNRLGSRSTAFPSA